LNNPTRVIAHAIQIIFYVFDLVLIFLIFQIKAHPFNFRSKFSPPARVEIYERNSLNRFGSNYHTPTWF
jgi:hypothetical protein